MQEFNEKEIDEQKEQTSENWGEASEGLENERLKQANSAIGFALYF